MRCLHHSCQGESHIISNKVCQDASYSASDSRMSLAIVCDGHGGERYVRSDIGAHAAVDVIKACVESFIENAGCQMFKGKTFTQRRAITSEQKDEVLIKESPIDKALRQLFSSIIYNWRDKIYAHAANNPLTDAERSLLSSEAQAKFEGNEDIEKSYGCTLMCYICTSSFWLAFHLGDGKCIAFDKKGEWCEPIPWDERCFLNKTTSICDADAINEFRYCYCGDGSFPVAVFLGSDGMDDSFGLDENMVNFYIQVLKLIAHEGEESAYNTIVETLPQLSKIGSKDDMSIACVYNETVLLDCIDFLIGWQMRNVEESISEINKRITILLEKVERFSHIELTSQKSMIEYQYATKDIAKLYEQKKGLADRWNKFAAELYGESFDRYDDEIGFSQPEFAEEGNASTTPLTADAFEQEQPQSSHKDPVSSDSHDYRMNQGENEHINKGTTEKDASTNN